jgi:hypothetical protein
LRGFTGMLVDFFKPFFCIYNYFVDIITNINSILAAISSGELKTKLLHHPA